MRILLSSLLILAHLLCLTLPTTGAALDDGSTDTGVQVGREVADSEGSGGTFKAGSWASFLSPSYIIGSIQNATGALGVASNPSPLDFWEMAKGHEKLLQDYVPYIIENIQNATGVLVASNPSSSDFWEKAKEYEQLLQDYVPRLLGDAAEFFESTNFTDITSSMHDIVNCTATFRDNIKDALDAHNITFDAFAEELEALFMAIVNDLENIPPPDSAPGHAERANIVDKVLDDASLALINLATRYGIEEEVVTTYMIALKPRVQALIVTVGDINEQYPDLLPGLAFSIATMLIPQSWILRPLLRVFGFGPAGPVKGSIAAWLQRHFWGAAVKAGSWFSLLQKAGMGVYPMWAGLLAKLPLWFGGLLAMFFKRE